MIARAFFLPLMFLVFLSLPAAATVNFDNIFISGTPTEAEMASFKKQKGATVVDLRAIDELGNCSEPATAVKLGLQYNRVNFEKKETLDPKVLAQLDEVVAEAQGKPILLFCKTGSRAAAWLATYLVQEKKMSIEESLEKAKTAGLTESMEKSVRSYLSQKK